MISRRDSRRKENAGKADAANAQKAKVTPNNDIIREVPQMPSNLFFQVRRVPHLRMGTCSAVV